MSEGISACSHHNTHWVAVVHHRPNTLDIYDSKLSHRTHVSLGFNPPYFTAVAAVCDVLVVARYDPPGLFVYNWAGERVGELSWADLGVQEGYKHGVGRAVGDNLHVAAWDERE